MTIKSQIGVGNNAELGFDSVEAETTCHGFITLKLKLAAGSTAVNLELSRQDLREFLARTCPAFVTAERYEAKSV